MSTTISIEEAQVNLKELIRKLAPGEEIVITDNLQPVARLLSEVIPTRKQRPAPGLLKGAIIHMAPDFNEPLDDLKEYME